MSYVCRDDRTDDELKPSSVVQTLVEELNKGYLKEPFQSVSHPLKNYSQHYYFLIQQMSGGRILETCPIGMKGLIANQQH